MIAKKGGRMAKAQPKGKTPIQENLKKDYRMDSENIHGQTEVCMKVISKMDLWKEKEKC